MEIDYSRLTRDYKTNPLKRGEKIPKQDLQYLLVDVNLTIKQVSKIINRCPNQVGKQSRQLHIRKKPVEIVPQNEITDTQNMFLSKFPDVIIDYKNDCPHTWDYYIPSLDLYISYNIDQAHGTEAFNPNNTEHWKMVKHWADLAQNGTTNQQKNYYANLINTWTVKDPLKRNTARINKLNHKEFFTEKEFIHWYNSI